LKQIIKELVLLINEGVSLKEGFIVRAESSEAQNIQAIERWKYRVNAFLEENIGSGAAVDFKNNTKAMPSFGWDVNICDSLDSGIPILQSLKYDIEQNPKFWVTRLSKNKNIQKISSRSKMNSLDIVRKICSQFHIVAKQLKDHRHENRGTIVIEDEYDVQDLLHALLKIFYDDIRPEEWTPSYAGKSSRMDFLLKKEKIVIEVKKTREGLKEKQIADQIIIDIERYKASHADCKTLFCFVYDPEKLIQNPTGVEEDINKRHKGFAEVLICPKGL